ncbi:MAG: hypothetical protein EXR69_03650 [Myxococcales bacterium]|nr:hypothetical protein [Myxococcales bacterium]
MLLIAIFACIGEPAPTAPPPMQAVWSAVPAALLASTWQVRLAPDQARLDFEGRDSWSAYFKGDRVGALAAMATDGDSPGLQRMHGELAAMYEEAALLAAQSVKQAYGVDGQPTDPLEMAYLLGQAGVILADPSLIQRFGECGASTVPGLAARDAAWAKWRDDAAAGTASKWPNNDVPGRPGDVVVGQVPGLGPVPSYVFPERTPEKLAVQAADLMSVWELSIWHARAVVQASGADVPTGPLALINAHRIPGLGLADWRDAVGLAAVPTVAPHGPPSVPDAMLFLGPYTTGGDLALAAALQEPGSAGEAVAAHLSDSPYAAIIQSCTTATAVIAAPTLPTEQGARPGSVPSGISINCILDQSAAFGTAIQDGMATAAGAPQGFHRFFADQARAGLLRVSADAAFAVGDTDTGGRLRLNAIDRAVGKAYDPVFALQVAAWDAGNRNSVRATELVHPLVEQVPGLDIARVPLDALHVRLSRNAAPAVPMH